MADLERALSAADDALAAAEPIVDPPTLADLRRELDAARVRHGHLGNAVVAALVGGTGSGKSSLLNAIAGTEVAQAGVLRPTTDQPTAWVPRSGGVPLDRLLDDLGVEQRVVHDRDLDVAVLDLPDLDSVERSHRRTVDDLLPRVDLVVWVLDPQKYNDLQVHELVRERRRWAAQLVFVLNQSDRLGRADRDAVLADLVASLRDDGIPAPTVLATAAAPADGPPAGVDGLWAELGLRAEGKAAVLGKLTSDLHALADRLEAHTGGDALAPEDLAARWSSLATEVADEAAVAVVDDVAVTRTARAGARAAAAAGSGPVGRLWHGVRSGPVGRALGAPQEQAREAPAGRAPLEPAAHTLSRGLLDLAISAGGPLGRRVRTELTGEPAEQALRGAVRAATDDGDRHIPVRGWWRAIALVQALLTVGVVVGLVWAWSDPTALRPGDLPWPAVLVLGGVVVGLLLRRGLRASGAAAGRRLAMQRRERVARDVVEGLDRRVGQRLDDLLADHRRAGAALGQLRATL